VRGLNRLYRSVPALHARDCEPEGFQWIVVDDANQSVLAWLRFGGAGDTPAAIACNFTPEARAEYRVGLPFPGRWREVMNTDASVYGGSGLGNLGCVEATAHPSHGMPASATMLLPPLAAVYFQFEPG
jgi:1,4-alpha-glucan branching enzyme